jgi:S1-C subfamily serine protease
MKVSLKNLSLFAGALLLATQTLPAENNLPDEQRTNGANTLKAISRVQSQAIASTVRLGLKPEGAGISGTIISADGYLLTVASEFTELKKANAFLSDGTHAELREVKRDEKFDLALLKIDRTGLAFTPWEPAPKLEPAQWLCAYSLHHHEMRLGVFSAKRRTIPNSGAVIGVTMGKAEYNYGVAITRVAEESPAEKAGLMADDVILAVNDQTVKNIESVKRILSKFRPGDTVKIHYEREGKPADCEVQLASRSRVQLGSDDFANHGTSLRTDNFPEILQHDMPLSPEDMGSAVYDLEGKAVGFNIARVDRVTNYALPSELFAKEVEAWIKTDRAKVGNR